MCIENWVAVAGNAFLGQPWGPSVFPFSWYSYNSLQMVEGDDIMRWHSKRTNSQSSQLPLYDTITICWNKNAEPQAYCLSKNAKWCLKPFVKFSVSCYSSNIKHQWEGIHLSISCPWNSGVQIFNNLAFSRFSQVMAKIFRCT